MKRKNLMLIPVAALCALVPARASLSCTGTGETYFHETGTNGAGNVQDAEACVTIAAGTVTIIVDNDAPAGTLTNIPNVIDAFSLNLTGSGFSVTGISNVTAENPIFCENPNSDCVVDTGYYDQSGKTPTLESSPYEWTLNTTANNNISTTNNELLQAGGSALHPFGIVNSSVLSNTNNLSSVAHNDYLESDDSGNSGNGFVEFQLSYTGTAPTGVNAFTFYFGTNADAQNGCASGVTCGSVSTPEPTSILLLGTALAVAGGILRKRLSV